MQKSMPILKIALVVCVAFLAAVTVLGLAVGAEKPFATVYPMLIGLIAIGMLSVWPWATPNCLTCGTRQPAQRKPTSLRQALWGGWNCAQCGTEIDRNGHAIGVSSGARQE